MTRCMNRYEFANKMANVIPTLTVNTLQGWIDFAEKSDTRCTLSGEEFYKRAYIEFSLTKQYYGDNIVQQIFDLSKKGQCLNSFEIRGAAKNLYEGINIEGIYTLAVNGQCDLTLEEAREHAKMMELLNKKYMDSSK